MVNSWWVVMQCHTELHLRCFGAPNLPLKIVKIEIITKKVLFLIDNHGLCFIFVFLKTIYYSFRYLLIRIEKIFWSFDLCLLFRMKYKFHFQNANYFYLHTQFKNNFIFKIQTIYIFKFNSKISFMYKFQHDNDGPPYLSNTYDGTFLQN